MPEIFDIPYHHHPVDDIEPIIEDDGMFDVTNYFLRLFAWINDGKGHQGRSIRVHVVMMIIFPQLGRPEGGDYTNDNIGKAYGLTRQAVNVVVQQFRDQFPSANIKNRSMRSQETRTKCKLAQKKANSKHQTNPLLPRYERRTNKLRSLLISP